MAVDTGKSTETKSAETAKSATATVDVKSPARKPAARPRAAKSVAPEAAKPAKKPAPATAKATSAVKKAAIRPTVRKSPPAKQQVTHEPEPFVTKNSKAGKPAKAKKAKLVRDSFTMPETEYAVIAMLKKRCLAAGVSAKKSEILRAAVANLAKLSDASLLAALRRLEVIKTGRPAKGSK